MRDSYRHWPGRIAALDDVAMRTPLGPKRAYSSADPTAGLICPSTGLAARVNRETMCGSGEIGCRGICTGRSA